LFVSPPTTDPLKTLWHKKMFGRCCSEFLFGFWWDHCDAGVQECFKSWHFCIEASIWFRIIISEHLRIDVSCIMVHPVVLQLVTEKWHATRFVCRHFTFITHCHPKVEILQRIIRKYWIGFKRNRNIGELVKRAIR
jgi:hypothetical protein